MMTPETYIFLFTLLSAYVVHSVYRRTAEERRERTEQRRQAEVDRR